MKVKLLTTLAGQRRTYAVGEVVDLPTADATRLIERELAEPIRNQPEIETPSRVEQTVQRPGVERRGKRT